MILFGFLLFALAQHSLVVIATNCPVASRDDLLQCLDTYVDTNHDSIITVEELDAFLSAQEALGAAACLPQSSDFYTHVNGTMLVELCDVNQDGNLTVTGDWDAATGCAQSYDAQLYLCQLCYMNGWTGPSVQKRGHMGSTEAKKAHTSSTVTHKKVNHARK